MIHRREYLSRIEPFIGKGIVKVLIGMRRSGKSTLLNEIRDGIIESGVNPENIVTINFESMQWEHATASPQAFYKEVLKLAEKASGQLYLFFDEIQAVTHWEKAINSLRVDLDCDIYITGSNSKLLSGELSTLLAGRYVAFEVLPFSLKELAKAFPHASIEDIYSNYRIYGGLPFLSHIDYAAESSIAYLRDVFNSIVLKDIVQRHSFRNSDQLERILSYFISEIGTTYSVDNIVNVLKSENRSISSDSVYNYLQAAEDAMLITRVKRYDIKGKSLLRGSEKVYLTDIGIREALLGNNNRRVDMILENEVFLELKRRGFGVSVGRIGNKEVDFVAEKRGEKLYVQAAYLLESESTRRRVFAALEAISDNFPKMVVSTDKADWSRDGIRCWNIVDFLTSDGWDVG